MEEQRLLTFSILRICFRIRNVASRVWKVPRPLRSALTSSFVTRDKSQEELLDENGLRALLPKLIVQSLPPRDGALF